MTSGGAENADLVDCRHFCTTSSSPVASGIVRVFGPLRKSADIATFAAVPSRRASPLLLVAVTALLAACGGGGHAKGITIGDCLNNDENFLVQQSARGVNGMSPSGVNFTLTRYKSTAAARAVAEKNPKTAAVVENAVVDFGGNPSQARITTAELAAIKRCLDKARAGRR